MNEKEYLVKFCVFLGREKNIKILHSYIELGLQKEILDEYHMFDFSRNNNDHNFIFDEYNRLSNIYKNRIFLHNYNENNIFLLNDKQKTDWSPFYKIISSNTKDNDIIIKCDDDILFIDIYMLKNAIIDRYNDKKSFLIHSNCINNGVCAYYQRELFPNLKDKLQIYPKGGILGILFEKPEIASALHIQFTNDLISSINNIDNYKIDNNYINTRISINFILINGADAKYLNNISYNDEYELSSLIPETLCRYNKIYGNLITSHLSYSFQDKIILKNNNIINNYSKIRDLYINLKNYSYSIYNNLYKEVLLKCHVNNDIYKVKNWIKNNSYYIKNVETNKYLYIDYDEDELILSEDKKTIFEINNENVNMNNNNIVIINLGIYFFTRYNCKNKFRNENILIKCYNDNIEKYIIKENIDEYDNFYFKFAKYNNYLSINKDNNIDVTIKNTNKWFFEKNNNNDEYIYVTRFIKNNKYYYKNIENNEIYTNYYMGWGLENILW
jgi:hypothetical protein